MMLIGGFIFFPLGLYIQIPVSWLIAKTNHPKNVLKTTGKAR